MSQEPAVTIRGNIGGQGLVSIMLDGLAQVPGTCVVVSMSKVIATDEAGNFSATIFGSNQMLQPAPRYVITGLVAGQVPHIRKLHVNESGEINFSPSACNPFD